MAVILIPGLGLIGDRGRPSAGIGTGWGVPAWSPNSALGFQAGMPANAPPKPVGARYFCGDCDSVKENEPVAQGNVYSKSRLQYQVEVTAHYQENHPDLHYPIDQIGIDAMYEAKRNALSILRQHADMKALSKWKQDGVGGHGTDMSGFFQPVARPSELPDFTEFDFPDANVADAGVEEIELDQLISLAARQGRRFLGVELQNLDGEFRQEYLTAADNADLDIDANFQLNTRTGAHNLDDAENLWRYQVFTAIANIEATAGTGTAISETFWGRNDVPPGGTVYVTPRLFWRFTNNMDRQIDTGDLFTRIATIDQRLSTRLLFELLEQFADIGLP